MTLQAPELEPCAPCAQPDELQETVKLKKTQILALQDSLSKTTTALATLTDQIRNHDDNGSSSHAPTS